MDFYFYKLRKKTNEVHIKPRLVLLSCLSSSIDVNILTSSISKCLEPNIHFKLKQSDGRVISFEISVKKFHALRYAVGLILKDIYYVENRQVFKFNE